MIKTNIKIETIKRIVYEHVDSDKGEVELDIVENGVELFGLIFDLLGLCEKLNDEGFLIYYNQGIIRIV